jgi:hypothetical protein
MNIVPMISKLKEAIAKFAALQQLIIAKSVT